MAAWVSMSIGSVGSQLSLLIGSVGFHVNQQYEPRCQLAVWASMSLSIGSVGLDVNYWQCGSLCQSMVWVLMSCSVLFESTMNTRTSICVNTERFVYKTIHNVRLIKYDFVSRGHQIYNESAKIRHF